MTNSSSSSATLLVVAMMLSSGVCFSDAFSTTAPQSLLRLRSSTRPSSLPLCYAPRNSFDRESERPKRRPGRPRKADSTSTTTAAAAPKSTSTSRKSTRSGTVAAATKKKSSSRKTSAKRKITVTAASRNTSTDGATRRQQQSRPKIRSPGSNTKKAISKKTDLLSHELLTKEEEQELFRRMRRAMEVQDTMTAWVEANAKSRLEDIYQASTTSSSSSSSSSSGKTEENPQNEMEEDEGDAYFYAYNELFGSNYYDSNNRVNEVSQAQVPSQLQQPSDEDEADFDESKLYNELMYGTSNQRAIEQYLAQADEAEDLFYQDGTLFQVNEDESYGAFSPESPVPQLQQQQEQSSPSTSTNSWLDDLLLKDGDKCSSSWLTDEDILQALDLSGGRGQLRTILLEGALAREKLISSNFKLVMGIANKWASTDLSKSVGSSNSGGDKKQSLEKASLYGYTSRPTMDEALSEGVLGLAEAAERFNPDRGFKFSTYATFWVTNYVRKLYYRESTQGIRLPDNYYDIKRKYTKLVKGYLRSPGAEVPPMNVLAVELGVTEPRLTNVLRMTRPILSMDHSINQISGADGEMYTLASIQPCDEPAPEDYVERSFLRQCLENAMAVECTPSERDILRLRLGLDDGEPRTVNEVADVYGGAMSPAVVRGMEKKAFKKLRSPYAIHTQKLIAYLDFAGIDGKEALLN